MDLVLDHDARASIRPVWPLKFCGCF